jgi:hypothetical protein
MSVLMPKDIYAKMRENKEYEKKKKILKTAAYKRVYYFYII